MPESAIPTTEEEKKKKKKKKKNFQSVTGVRFKDLILPLALGGISAYSRPAARGATVGLSAYKAFQAGGEVAREREVGEKAAEYHSERAGSLKAAQQAAGEAVEDPTQTGKWLFQGQDGPSIPTPTVDEYEKHLEDTKKPSVFGDIQEPPTIGGFEKFSQSQMPGYLQPPDQQAANIAAGIQQEAQDPTDPSVIQETISDTRQQAILDYKQRVEQARAPYESDIRNSEMAALMAPANPAWSLGLQMQAEQRKEKTRDSLLKINALEAAHSRGRAEKAMYEERDRRIQTATEAELIKIRGEVMGNQWTIEDVDGIVYAIDQKKRDGNGNPIMHELSTGGRAKDFIELLEPNQLLSQYERMVSNFVDEADYTDAGSQEDAIRRGRIPVIRAMRERIKREFPNFPFEPIPGIDDVPRRRPTGSLEEEFGFDLENDEPFDDPVGLFE